MSEERAVYLAGENGVRRINLDAPTLEFVLAQIKSRQGIRFTSDDEIEMATYRGIERGLITAADVVEKELRTLERLQSTDIELE